MKNNFIQRAVTGVLFVIVLVGCILYSPLSFGILFTIISALSVHEFAQLVSKSGEVSINKTITALGGSLPFPCINEFLYPAVCRSTGIPSLFGTIALHDDYGTLPQEKESDG